MINMQPYREKECVSERLRKKRNDMPMEKIAGHVSRDDGFICLQSVGITRAHFCGNLERDMQQLPEVKVIAGRGEIVPECGTILL